MIDGMLGMAYGVSCRTFLSMFTGVPTAAVSAVVHYAEVPTSFVSMISHIKLKNIDKDLFLRLVIPGVIGSVIGAYIITNSFDWIELVVDVYLVIMGARVFAQAFKHEERKFRHKYAIYVLGFAGAFFRRGGRRRIRPDSYGQPYGLAK